jgi:hypothetical protein
MYSKRISIFTGHFGSGKTEVAVNYTLRLNELGYKTAIVDFDIVNPYFRTADVKDYMEDRNIKVIVPLYANTNVDVPALPAEINTLFENKEYKVVFDVGGDDLGATAISRYKEEFLEDDYQHLFVANIKRPMTNTVEKIEEMFHSIENCSGLKITGIVNNTNLLGDTSINDLLEGNDIIGKAAERLGVPIAFTSGFYKVLQELDRLKDSNNLDDMLYMEKMIRLPWEKTENR